MKALKITGIALIALGSTMLAPIAFAGGSTDLKVTQTQSLNPKAVQRPEQKKYKRLRPTQQSKPVQQASKAHYITVKSGDTLSKIAQRHNVTLAQVQRLNKLYGKKANHIRVGQRIRIS